QKPIEPVEAMVIPNGKPVATEVPSVANGVARIELSDKGPVNGHNSSQSSVDSVTRAPSSSTASRAPTRIPSLATVAEKTTIQTTPPTTPSASVVIPSQ